MPPFQLFLFATDPVRIVAAGAAGIVVDWERRGKARRQLGEGTQINADTLDGPRRDARGDAPGRVLCRINGFGPWTAAEVDEAVAPGADEILLPMVRTTEEVDRALDAGRRPLRARHPDRDAGRRRRAPPRWRAGRCRASTSGSTTCASTAASTELFRPLVDGTVDAVRAEVAQPFGVAGLTLPERGRPVPSRLLAGEMVRLGCRLHLPAAVVLPGRPARRHAVRGRADRSALASPTLRLAEPIARDSRILTLRYCATTRSKSQLGLVRRASRSCGSRPTVPSRRCVNSCERERNPRIRLRQIRPVRRPGRRPAAPAPRQVHRPQVHQRPQHRRCTGDRRVDAHFLARNSFCPAMRPRQLRSLKTLRAE